MKKKIWGIIISLAIAASFVPPVSAADAEGQDGSISWSLSGSTLTLSGTGVVPEDFVWDTGLYREYAHSVKSLIIESGITSIGYGAFEELGNLTEVHLADTVKTIGDDAFSGLRMLRKVEMPAVTSIGEMAFYRTAIEEEYSPLPSSLEVIGASAFSGTSYTSFELPAAVRSIGEGALKSSYLLNITVADGNRFFSAEDGVLFNSGKTELIYYPARKHMKEIDRRENYVPDDYTLPQSVKKIDKDAFYDAVYLGKIVFPPALEEIGAAAFNNYRITDIDASQNNNFVFENGILYDTAKTKVYTGLTKSLAEKVQIEDTVTEIGDCAFEANDTMTELLLPKNLLTIGSSAFSGCEALETVTMYPKVSFIGRYAFSDDTAITAVNFYGTNSQWTAVCDSAERNNTCLTNAEVNFLQADNDAPAFNSLVYNSDADNRGWNAQFYTGKVTDGCVAVAAAREKGTGELLAVRTLNLTDESKTYNILFEDISRYAELEVTVYCWDSLEHMMPVWETPLTGAEES